ncbi:hypothetical protein ZIOFF_069860 [Zingiber officinale]|uniref:PDZ domain-containing protein n=1 Tax=Zingiber officinale TaxID=94328 RepID=A0A8J5C6K3_ZINOF|nr:hypothetical protein ZIOFF_069860 [Zingiber officinale]
MSEFQLPYKAISHAEFETVKEKLNQVAHSIGQPLNADTLFFKAPFEEVPELFVGCRVFLKKVFLMLRCIRCAAVDSGGNAAKAGLRVGDQVLYTSNFFGDELWPADKLGFTKIAIQAKPDSVYFVVNRGAEWLEINCCWNLVASMAAAQMIATESEPDAALLPVSDWGYRSGIYSSGKEISRSTVDRDLGHNISVYLSQDWEIKVGVEEIKS